MHARLVRFQVRPGAASSFVAAYERTVLSALSETAGCLGAALLVHARRDEDLFSLTLWRERGSALAYDRDGRFARLLNQVEELLPGGGEEDGLSIGGYAAELLAPAELSGALVPATFGRTIAARVAPDRIEEFDRRYRAETRSALHDFPGLFSVLLLHGADRPTDTIGLSFWRDEGAAARYELSGRFEELAEDLRETLSPLDRWRAAVAAASRDGLPSRDFDVELYRVETARRFWPAGDGESGT